MAQTPNLNLPLILSSQSQKEVTHAEALNRVDALLLCSVLDKDLSSPPASPVDGVRYIVGPSATGAWFAQEGSIAAYYSGWVFYTPKEGWELWVEDENRKYRHNGTTWVAVTGAPGWTAATGTASRSSFDTASVTLPTLAGVLKALIDDLKALQVLG